MENFRELINAFVNFYSSAEVPLKFGIILILCVVALMLLVYIPKGIVGIIQWIISLFSKKKENPKDENSSLEEQPSFNLVTPIGYAALNSDKERRTAQYFEDELRKFGSDIDAIHFETLKEEKAVAPSLYTADDISDENRFELSDQRKAEIRRRFENLGTKELKRQQVACAKKQETVSKELGEINLTYRALLVSRDQAQDRCATLHQTHKSSLQKTRECQDRVRLNAEECKQGIARTKATLDQEIFEKDRILEELEQNRKDINATMETGGKQIISAHALYASSKREIDETQTLYREDTAAYLGGVSELNAINNDLSNYLGKYESGSRQKLELAYSVECIGDILAEIQKELEEKRIREAEEAAKRDREKAEKKAEERRLAKEKAEAERKAREEAAEERARKEAEEKAEAERLAIQQARSKMNASNQRADDAATKEAELDERARALDEEKAEIEAQKLSLAEERARDRSEREKQKATAKAERERKEAQEKAEKAAREKAELEALEDLTEEELQMRRKVEQANSEFSPRSALAAEEGFVTEQRIAEIEESQRTLDEERAKREAERDARQKAVDDNHSRIMAAEATIADESMTPEERTEALRQSWRAERENKEKFAAEKARKALETEQRRQELAAMRNNDQE